MTKNEKKDDQQKNKIMELLRYIASENTFFHNTAVKNKMKSLLRSAMSDSDEGWARCLLKACNLPLDRIHYDIPEDAIETALMMFCESIYKNTYARKKLESLTRLPEKERIEQLYNYINLRTISFKTNYLNDLWRKEQGTSSDLYRRVQQIMSRNLAPSWTMYDTGRYYGHEGLKDTAIKKIDMLNDSYLIRSFALPSDYPPEKNLMQHESLWSLGKFFHEEVCAKLHSPLNTTILAVRNFSYWLSTQYAGLVVQEQDIEPTDTQKQEDGDKGSYGPEILVSKELSPELQLAARELGRLFAKRTSPEDIRLLIMYHYENKTMEDCAKAFNLRGASAIKYRLDNIPLLPKGDYPVDDKTFQRLFFEELLTAAA